MIEELRHAGYNVFEASVSAFGSNWARAAELYAYIKGGTVDYGRRTQQNTVINVTVKHMKVFYLIGTQIKNTFSRS